MRLLLLPCCLLMLCFLSAGPGGADEAAKPAKAPRFAHASIEAYSNAVVSLRAPDSGMIFYVESDGRRLVALDRQGVLAWGVDVFEEAKVKPYLGKPVIRHLRLDGDNLWATCGKKDSVRIDVDTGKAEWAGRD